MTTWLTAALLALPLLGMAQQFDETGKLAGAAIKGFHKARTYVDLTKNNYNDEVGIDDKVMLVIYSPNLPASADGTSSAWQTVAEPVLRSVAQSYGGKVKVGVWKHGQEGTDAILARYNVAPGSLPSLPTFIMVDGRAQRGTTMGMAVTKAAFEKQCREKVKTSFGI